MSDSLKTSSQDESLLANVHKELKNHAKYVIEHCPDEQWGSLLREKVADLKAEYWIRDSDIKAIIAKAVLNKNPRSKGKRKGDKLDLTPVPWALDGLIMRHRMNMVIAEPKVGKTSFLISLLSAWHYGSDQFIGRQFDGPCPPVILVGTDQPEVDWATMLHAEGLMTGEGELLDPLVSFFSAGQPLYLDEHGFETLDELCAEFPDALVILDSYHTCVAPTGIEDSGSNYAGPMARLLAVTASHRATTIVIHHANKGTGGSIVSKARGTTALTAIPSQNILLAPMASENNPTDKRVMVKTQGRAGQPQNLIIERCGDEWVCHGSGDEVVESQKREDSILNLPERDAEVFAYIQERTELGFPVAQNEITANRDFKMKQYQTSRTCTRLVRAGLIYQEGATVPTVAGGRPSPLFLACGGVSPQAHTTHQVHLTSRVHEIKDFNAVKAQNALMQRQGIMQPIPAFNQPVEVQLTVNGSWTNGHITCGPAPGNQLFVRLDRGDPNIRKPLPLDRIRPCQPTPDPFDF